MKGPPCGVRGPPATQPPASPAIKAVLQEVEEGFLHHVRDLRREGNGGAGVPPDIPPACPPPQTPPIPHLVALQRRSHQDDGPHGGHHVVRGHVLGLRGRAGWGGGGGLAGLRGRTDGRTHTHRHTGGCSASPLRGAALGIRGGGLGGGELQAGGTPSPPRGPSRGGPDTTHRFLLLLRYVPRGRAGPGGGREKTNKACVLSAGGTELGWGGGHRGWVVGVVGVVVPPPPPPPPPGVPPRACFARSMALLWVRFGVKRGLCGARRGGWGAARPPPSFCPVFFWGGGSSPFPFAGEERHRRAGTHHAHTGGPRGGRGGGDGLIHPIDHRGDAATD